MPGRNVPLPAMRVNSLKPRVTAKMSVGHHRSEFNVCLCATTSDLHAVLIEKEVLNPYQSNFEREDSARHAVTIRSTKSEFAQNGGSSIPKLSQTSSHQLHASTAVSGICATARDD